jgi:hypothetical protein
MAANRIGLIGRLSALILATSITIALAQNTSNPMLSGNTGNPILSGNSTLVIRGGEALGVGKTESRKLFNNQF